MYLINILRSFSFRFCSFLRIFLSVAICFSSVGVGAAHAQSTAEVETRVREYFVDAPVMIAIARCESKFRQFTDSGNPLYGGAGAAMVGVFQVNGPVHREFAGYLGHNIDTLEGNLAYAKYLYETEGTTPWFSSRTCWENEDEKTMTPIEAHSTESVSLDTLQSKNIQNPSAALTPVWLTRTLRLDAVHEEVRTLQRLLNTIGFVVAENGPGSPENETNIFGPLTRDAVRRFQCARQIICEGDESSTGYGLVGPRTREALRVHASEASGSAGVPFDRIPATNNASVATLQMQIDALTAQVALLLAQIEKVRTQNGFR